MVPFCTHPTSPGVSNTYTLRTLHFRAQIRHWVRDLRCPGLPSEANAFGRPMQREASKGTSKLAPNAVSERENVKFEVCTYWERRGLLFGCKISSNGVMAGSEVKS